MIEFAPDDGPMVREVFTRPGVFAETLAADYRAYRRRLAEPVACEPIPREGSQAMTEQDRKRAEVAGWSL